MRRDTAPPLILSVVKDPSKPTEACYSALILSEAKDPSKPTEACYSALMLSASEASQQTYGSMFLRPFAGILTSRLWALVPPFDTIKNVRAGQDDAIWNGAVEICGEMLRTYSRRLRL